ncbi:MAG: hypothetical protein J07HB67_00361 [halophilic archaeon J07HB67]|nr:MAG: hypothetical protein J07HB67_00361 [halophilic archaeon J07HB67]
MVGCVGTGVRNQTHSLAGSAYSGTARRRGRPAGGRGSLVGTILAVVAVHVVLFAVFAPVVAVVAVGAASVALAA